MPVEFNHAGIYVSDIEASTQASRPTIWTASPARLTVEIIQRDVDWYTP